MHRAIHILVLSTFAAAAPSALSQTTWHVDAAASGPGDGSAANPFPAIQTGVAAASGGDTVLVAPGTYTENVAVHARIDLVSIAGPHATTIAGGLVAAGGTASSPARVEGFTIASAGGANVFGSTLKRCILRNPTPLSPGSRAVLFDDYARLENCVVTGFATAIVVFGFATDPGAVVNTIFVDNGAITGGSGAPSQFLHCCLPEDRPDAQQTVVGAPGVWDLLNLDFRLAPGSPCIDAGQGLDPDGSAADIGVEPFDPAYATGPATYCTTSPTGDGCVATISAAGTCSATAATPFIVSASSVSPDRVGRLLYSLGASNQPFQGGILCLAHPLTRTTRQLSGSMPPFGSCSGTYAFDFNAYLRAGAAAHLPPGTVVHAQYRFRDPLAPSGFGIGWSDAVRFGIAP